MQPKIQCIRDRETVGGGGYCTLCRFAAVTNIRNPNISQSNYAMRQSENFRIKMWTVKNIFPSPGPVVSIIALSRCRAIQRCGWLFGAKRITDAAEVTAISV